MAFWTFFGLGQGKVTTAWPAPGGKDGQEGLLGMPRFDAALCVPDCRACADACPTAAIAEDADGGITVDYGRCVVCQLCTEACPTGAMQPSSDWAFGVRRREDLVLGANPRRRRNSGPARSAAACISAMSMRARATAASSSSARSTTRSTTSIGSGYSSPPRRDRRTFCWSPGRSRTRCWSRCARRTRRCPSRTG